MVTVPDFCFVPTIAELVPKNVTELVFVNGSTLPVLGLVLITFPISVRAHVFTPELLYMAAAHVLVPVPFFSELQ